MSSAPTVTRVVAWWNRFAFEPTDPAPMAAVRVAAGLLCLGWALSYLPDAAFFLGSHGAEPTVPATYLSGDWSVGIGPPVLALLLLAAAAVALTVGAGSRVASIVALVALTAIQRRNPETLNSGDELLRALVFYVVLMPSGECWSVDAWLRRRWRGLEPRDRAPWGLRLLQIQVSVIYFFAVWDKLQGTSWANGTAVGMALQIEDLQRIALPHWLLVAPPFAALVTYGTLATEIFLVFGLWVPRLRWYAMGAGVALHLGIDATILVGWFSYAVIACYLAFVPAPVLRAAVAWVRNRLGRTAPTASSPAPANPEPVA